MLGTTSWECHKVREFALRPMGDFLLVLDRDMIKSFNGVAIFCCFCVLLEKSNIFYETYRKQ